EVFDVALRPKFQLLFHLNLDPQPLAIKTVLVALLFAVHGVVALIYVLVSAAPGVVDPHRVVGGNRAVEKGPDRTVSVLLAESVERTDAIPELQYGPFLCGEINLRFNLLERHERTLAGE